MPDHARRWGLVAVAAAIVAVGPAALALTGAGARPGAPLLVVAPPWRDAEAVVRAAGGWATGLRDAPLAVIAAFHAPEGAADRAISAGAWIAFDAGTIAEICGANG